MYVQSQKAVRGDRTVRIQWEFYDFQGDIFLGFTSGICENNVDGT